MRSGWHVLVGAGLSVLPITLVVAVLLHDAAESKPPRSAESSSCTQEAFEASAPLSGEEAVSTADRPITNPGRVAAAASLPFEPRSPTLSPASTTAVRADPDPGGPDPVEVHKNLASLTLREAFQEQRGDRLGAEQTRQHIAEQRALLPDPPVDDATVD